MRQLQIIFPVALAVCGLASVLASSASASGPTLLFTTGEPGPTVLINNKPKEVVATELQSEVAKFTGNKLTLELTLLQTRTGITGIYLAKFFEIEKVGTGTCETEKAAELNEIEVGPEGKSFPITLVYTSLSPLEVGPLFTVNSFTVKCQTLKVKIFGNMLGTISPINTKITAGSNTLTGGLTCKAIGVPSKTKYWNAGGLEKSTLLLSEVAEKAAGSCELIGPEITSTIKLLPTKAVEIMG